MTLVFNQENTDYLEELTPTTSKWRFDGVKSEFAGHSKLDDMTGCLSSSCDALAMFDGADDKCGDIIGSICTNGQCKPEDVSKAPTLKIVFKSYEFEFAGSDYLYGEGSGDDYQLKCRFSDPNKAENCQPGDMIIGKGFYQKYVPVLRYSTGEEQSKNDDMVASLGWLKWSSFAKFENAEETTGSVMKWTFVGVSLLAVGVISLIQALQNK